MNDILTQAAGDRPPAEPGRALVQIRDVGHWFGQGEGRLQVLFNNNLTINTGEIVIMTGPSGSGKTTLLTLIGALRAVQEGSLKVLGQELRGLHPGDQVKVRRNIGFIFQAHNLFESLTAFQNVKLATELHDTPPPEAKARCEQILGRLGLAEHIHKKPQGLSGGQRQRVAICRALVNQPRLILADEPTAALDKDTGRQVVDLFKELAQTQGSTVLIVTHDNRILDVADRIVNMVDGYVASDVDVAESLTVAKFLKKCSVFEASDPHLIADIANKMNRETHPAGTEVIRQGDVGDKFYIIRAGRMDVIKEAAGQKTVVASLGPGDFFGELALLRKEPRAATVRAAEQVDLLTLSKDLFTMVVESSATFEEKLRRVYFHA